MGNKSQNRTNDLLGQAQNRSLQDYGGPINDVRNRSNETYNSSRGMLPGLQSRFSNWADTGGFSPDSFNALRSTYGGGGSGIASELGSTGGIDESKFSDALAGYKDFAGSSGGVDVEGMRQRGYRAVPQFFNNLKNEAEHRRLVNPYAPSFDAEQSSLARQMGQQTQESIADTDLGINEAVRQGRQFGIKGLGDLNSTIQEMSQRGKIAGGQLAESAASRRTNAEMAIMQAMQEGRLKGLGGLTGLFDTENSNAGNYLRDYFGGLSGRDSSQLGFISNRQNTTPWWKTLLNAGSSAAGAYAGGMGGRG